VAPPNLNDGANVASISHQYPEYYYHYQYQEVSAEAPGQGGLKQSWPRAKAPVHWPQHPREESFIQVPQGFIAILIPSAGGGWHHHHEETNKGCRKRGNTVFTEVSYNSILLKILHVHLFNVAFFCRCLVHPKCATYQSSSQRSLQS